MLSKLTAEMTNRFVKIDGQICRELEVFLPCGARFVAYVRALSVSAADEPAFLAARRHLLDPPQYVPGEEAWIEWRERGPGQLVDIGGIIARNLTPGKGATD